MKLKSILAVLVFLGIQYFSSIPLLIFNVDISSMSDFQIYLYLSCVNLFLLLFMIFNFKDLLKEKFLDFTKNHKEYINKNIKVYLLGLGFMVISNLIILSFYESGPANEEAIRDLFEVMPFYIFFASVIVAPICEELVFRQSFKELINNKYLFIIFSGVVFGAMHVVNSLTSLYDLFYIIPYSSLGLAFAYMLYKTKNIYVSMMFHLFHNGILVSLQFLLLFL